MLKILYRCIQCIVSSVFVEFYLPSNHQPNDGGKPSRRLHLDWVYGYRGRDSRSNLYVLPSGELLYYVAGVAVLYNKSTETQRHYTGHNEDITRLAGQQAAMVASRLIERFTDLSQTDTCTRFFLWMKLLRRRIVFQIAREINYGSGTNYWSKMKLSDMAQL